MDSWRRTHARLALLPARGMRISASEHAPPSAAGWGKRTWRRPAQGPWRDARPKGRPDADPAPPTGAGPKRPDPRSRATPAIRRTPNVHVTFSHARTSYWKDWCRLRDSNSRPTDYKSVALPTELNRRTFWSGLSYQSPTSCAICQPAKDPTGRRAKLGTSLKDNNLQYTKIKLASSEKATK